MSLLSAVHQPTLLIDEQKVRHNLQRMADRADRHSLAFRPHVKTHQSAVVSRWLQEMGVTEITVTSLRMARDLAGHGWQQMLIGMPVNPREIPALNKMAQTTRLTILLTSAEVATAVARDTAPGTLSFYVEVDAGYGRSGVSWQDNQQLRNIIAAAKGLRFRGVYVHSGHTYSADSPAAITAMHQQLLERLEELHKSLKEVGPYEVAIGDTPACSTQEDFRGITSIGPGNFVYYDLVQNSLGACQVEDIAVCLAAPVVQVIPERSEVIVHAGWVQLGKDQLPDGSYGKIVRLQPDGTWSAPILSARVSKLSQEHGTVKLPPDILTNFRPGDLLGILPVHACAAVHGMRATGSQRIIPA